MVDKIYPKELQLNKVDTSDTDITFLDLNLWISIALDKVFSFPIQSTVNPVLQTTCIKQSPLLKGHII